MVHLTAATRDEGLGVVWTAIVLPRRLPVVAEADCHKRSVVDGGTGDFVSGAPGGDGNCRSLPHGPAARQPFCSAR
jgi:hypothetical protein